MTTARAEGLVGCTRCARVWPGTTPVCGRCGARLESRPARPLRRVWGWWALGVAAYVPAMTWPMLETRVLLSSSADTAVGGAVALARHGEWLVAVVILVASVAIPVAKFGAVALLALAVGSRSRGGAEARHRLQAAVEFIGRWSMVDVFVVALLASTVRFSWIATVRPGPAVLAFAVSVLCTMLAARALDPRLIWDLDEEPSPRVP